MLFPLFFLGYITDAWLLRGIVGSIVAFLAALIIYKMPTRGLRYEQKKATKMKKDTGTFLNRKTKTGKKTYDGFFIYIPTEVAMDGTFHSQKKTKSKSKLKEKLW